MIAASDGLAVGLWAAGYAFALPLAVYGLYRLIRFLTPCDATEMTDMAETATDAAVGRATEREVADARPDGQPAPPALGGGLGDAGSSLVFLEDHGDDVPDDGISRLPVAEAVQDEPCDGPEIL